MDFSSYQFFKVERQDKVLTITIDSPGKLNCFGEIGHKELSRLFVDAAEDPDSEIVVLTGAGTAFSAGGDLEYMEKLRQQPSLMHRTVREAKRIVFSLLDCDKPIICKVNGDAIGLGTTLALYCDVVFAVETARFADPHNNVALIAGDGGAIMWPQLIGYARAKHYLFTGERMNAVEAQAMGLIHAAVPAAELDAKVDAYVQRLLKLPIQSIRWSKQTMNIGLKQLAHSMMDAGMAYEAMAAQTEDHQEAIDAFREKRKPSYKGR